VKNGFDPRRLTPIASLNRVRFVESAGLVLPADMLNRTAFELLSAQALADLARQHGDASDTIARRFGERLGWLIVTLRRGDVASRAARPDWDESYWRQWARVSTIYLGGGIVGGEIGPHLVRYASRTLEAAGLADCDIRLAAWPAHLPLIGAARTAPASRSAVVFDFGQSFVKRAVARYENGTLAALRLLPRLPARWTQLPLGHDPTLEHVRLLGNSMVQTMAETWRAASTADSPVSPTIVASLASYLRDGQPLARQGGAYAALLELSENLATWLADRVSHATGHRLTVRLLHDGTAAAYARAGEPCAAVITLGTALGVGFPPDSWSGCPLSSRFTVLDAVPS